MYNMDAYGCSRLSQISLKPFLIVSKSEKKNFLKVSFKNPKKKEVSKTKARWSEKAQTWREKPKRVRKLQEEISLKLQKQNKEDYKT